MAQTSKRSRLGTILIVLGVLAIAGAGVVYWTVQREEHAAGAASEAALQAIMEQIPQTKPGTPSAAPDEAAPYRETVLNVNGVDYLGYISFPSFGRELPVIANWNFNSLKAAPTRYTGSIATDDIVIAGHNYRSHFNILSRLEPGDLVVFTDASGNVIRYLVKKVEELSATAVEEMTAGAYDLTVFTCTYGGIARVTVRCDRAEQQTLRAPAS